MTYRIAKGESLAKAFGRIAVEEMDLAMTQLQRGDGGEAVHDARKALKRLRALLRSLRVACPENLYRAENRRLAEAAHKISPVRDLHVQLDTLEKLRKDDCAGDGVKRQLERQQTICIRKLPALRKTICQMLQASRQSICSLPVRDATPSDLAAGLRRIYKQGRSAFKEARHHPTAENLHEGRKKAKWLGYAFELIEGTSPRKVTKWRKSAEKLTEALGDDHDLFMVLTALRHAPRAMPDRDFRLLAKRIARKRAQRQKQALKIAKCLYREKPRSFGEQVDHYLRRAGTPAPSHI
jgi:CHAD domain-containing protein